MAIRVPPVPPGDITTNVHVWRDWFNKLQTALVSVGSILWTSIDFTGSKITDIQFRPHDDLQQIQGGASGDAFHLTQDELNQVYSDQVLIWLSM